MADLTSKVLGYRYWNTDDDGFLEGQGYRSWAWGLGVNEATCGEGDTHDNGAPAHDCSCGLHAYYAPQVTVKQRGPFENPGSVIYGVVRAWGRMEVHVNGYRAQYAEILALAYNDALPHRAQDRVKTLARDYEVEAIPLTQLTAYALEQADPMPKELIPERPKPVKRSPNSMVALSNAMKATWLSTPLNFSMDFGSARPGQIEPGRLEDIGLHTVEPGDILKYGRAA